MKSSRLERLSSLIILFMVVRYNCNRFVGDLIGIHYRIGGSTFYRLISKHCYEINASSSRLLEHRRQNHY
jgi:hypothetical protein